MATITRKISDWCFSAAFIFIISLLIIVLFIGFPAHSQAATCSSISRTNSSANSVLTSTKYNTDLNTVYSAANALDAGCLTDGTLEATALNSTDFAALLNGLTQGCEVTRSDDNTLSVGKCIASVNGSFVKTTVSNTVTWGCSGCSSETSSTLYYLYIKTGSSGTTLNLLISTTAPNADGYDNSGNKVLARFVNDPSSAIAEYSIDQWHINKFVRTSGLATTRGTNNAAAYSYFASINCDGSSSITQQIGKTPLGASWISSIGNISGGTCALTLASGALTSIAYVHCTISTYGGGTMNDVPFAVTYTSETSISFGVGDHTGAVSTAWDATIECTQF